MPILLPLPDDLSGDDEVARYWAAFATRTDVIEQALAGLGDATIEVRGNGGRPIGTVSCSDYHRKFSAITWSLTTDTFGNGGVGEIKSRWRKPNKLQGWISGEQRTNSTDFVTYGRHPDESGLIYLALHETAHVSELGIETWKRCWNAHKDEGGDRDDYANTALWRENEQVANAIVRSICLELDLPRLENPSVGYPD